VLRIISLIFTQTLSMGPGRSDANSMSINPQLQKHKRMSFLPAHQDSD